MTTQRRIQVGLIKETAVVGGTPVRRMELIAMFDVDYYVAGLAPYGRDLALLAFTTPAPTNTKDPKVCAWCMMCVCVCVYDCV